MLAKSSASRTPTPVSIKTILRQLGGLVMMRIGCARPFYLHRPEYRDGECRTLNFELQANGNIVSDMALILPVNGITGQAWRIVITLEPDDLYKVRLVRLRPEEQGSVAEVYAEHSMVFCEDLAGVVDDTYTDALNELNEGFLPSE